MAKNSTNDSLAQKQAKEQNRSSKNKNTCGDKHLSGPNHPAT